MRPEAHLAAAIEILDAILDGEPAERSLTNWGRTHRFAGSGDRAAIRDIVFDALRRRRSYAWQGGAETGRGLMLGRLREANEEPGKYFDGSKYAPAALSEGETQLGRPLEEASDPIRLDCPDWLWPHFVNDLGDASASVLAELRNRAPVFLRVNSAKSDRAQAIAVLAEDAIDAAPHPLAETALIVTRNARRIRNARAYKDGLVELQDAASQAVVAECVAHIEGDQALDYCAGGGGKALALAGTGFLQVTAHDADRGRMKDIPDRAARAGATIRTAQSVTGLFDLVLCDVPCSGSGAWRRQPEGKWQLDAARLAELNAIQDAILTKASSHVRSGGVLAYSTCSIFRAENDDRADAFAATHNDWKPICKKSWTPLDGADGFFLAIFRKY